MSIYILFWICWVIELGAFLVIGGDLWWRYSQRPSIPIAADVWKSSLLYLIVLIILIIGGLLLRHMDRPQWAFYLVVSPVALLLAFFVIAAIAIAFGARVN